MMNRILSLVGWLGTALVFVAVAIRFGFPAKEQYAYYLAWGGLVCVLLYTAGQWREIAKVFERRQTRYGTLTTTSVLVVLGILVAINYIGARQHKRWDLTANKQFGLAEQSRNVVEKLDAPVQIQVFADEAQFGRFQERLKEYEYASKNVKTEYIDPDKNPTATKAAGVTQAPMVLINYKGRTERITSDNEQDITNAIIKVTTSRQAKVYFTQGHGEKDTAGAERDGYNTIAGALAKENYTVDKVSIAQAGSVPADASIVVIAGPKVDFFAPEIDALNTYLGKQGKLLLEIDPPEKFDSPPLTNLIALAHEWGIQVGNNIVVDVSGMGRMFGTDASVPVVGPPYPSHPITTRFTLITAFPLAREASPISGGVDGHTAQPFIETSARSWAETDLKSLMTKGEVSLDESKGDKKGPIALGSAVSAAAPGPPPAPGNTDVPKPETRVVVIGDSDFASNAALGAPGNRDLFMNTIGWLAQQDNLISIRPKDPDDRRITLTATQESNLFWLSLLIIPALVFGAGLMTWMKRRA
jgi:ABC-type uncharacterized transport system involved in gliding motility auxiliary subunit